jgi:molybdate transport system regulatory protein
MSAAIGRGYDSRALSFGENNARDGWSMSGAKFGRPVIETRPLGVAPAQRIWLHSEGSPVFGMGVRELLMRVESTGSLRHAAADMGLAYSKAWHIVRRAEKYLGFALLERQTDGKHGGGSTVSDEGRWLVGAFGALIDEADGLLNGLYVKHFGNWHAGTGDVQIEEGAPMRASKQ